MTRVEPSGVSWFSFADTNYAVAFGFRRNVWLRFGWRMVDEVVMDVSCHIILQN